MRQVQPNDSAMAGFEAAEDYDAFIARFRVLAPSLDAEILGADKHAGYQKLVASTRAIKVLRRNLLWAVRVTGIVMALAVVALIITPWFADHTDWAPLALIVGGALFVASLFLLYRVVSAIMSARGGA
jgi:hypothetical protein